MAVPAVTLEDEFKTASNRKAKKVKNSYGFGCYAFLWIIFFVGAFDIFTSCYCGNFGPPYNGISGKFFSERLNLFDIGRKHPDWINRSGSRTAFLFH